jgi:hypothetical protein
MQILETGKIMTVRFQKICSDELLQHAVRT